MQQTNLLDAALLLTHLEGLVRIPSGLPVGAHTADASPSRFSWHPVAGPHAHSGSGIPLLPPLEKHTVP